MARYLGRRFLATIPVLLGISLLVFLMMHVVPGDPAQLMLGEMGTSPEAVANLHKQLGLDQPLLIQYLHYIGGALHGDLGRSFLQNQPVARLIGNVLPDTIILTLAGLGLAVLLGVLFGTLAAVRSGTWLDTICMFLALLGVSMPSFWLGLMLVFTFSLTLGLLPATGTGGIERLVMPAVTLAVGAAAVIARLVRASVLEVTGSDYTRTARAKGLAERRVVLRHILRNALIPVTTVIGLQFGSLLSGTVVIETVFSRPGLGRLMVGAILNKDFPVVQGGVFLSAAFYLLINLLVDASYAWLDPRITYS